jgi:RND family efflux transporter MFP subunit
MTTIVSTGEAHVYVDVDATTIRRFRKAEAEGRILLDEGGNIPVQLRLDQGSDFSHAGHVESLDNRIDPETGSLTVRLLFPDERDELLPGSFVRVRLPVSDAENRIVVSERAIGTDQNQKYVLTVQSDSTVAYRKVTLGPVIDGERIITDGIVPGESVIINGLQRVRPGMTVNAESAATLDSTGLAQR